MKWIFYVIVFIYMLYRAVYGAKFEEYTVNVDHIDNEKITFWNAGDHKSIYCRTSNKNKNDVVWIDPNRKVVRRNTTDRLFAQEHFAQSMRGASRTPALVLNFKELSVTDSGKYECHSGNKSDYAFVCVIDPLEFVQPSTEIMASIGRSITLSCEAKGDPEPSIIWRRDEESIDEENNNDKYKVMTKYNRQGFEGLLTITSLVPEDSGVYSCMALQENLLVDNCKHSAFNNITLQVNYAPIFDDGNDTKVVYGEMNESVDLVCSANGYPKPTYRWFRDDGSDTLFEYDKNQITVNKDDNEAILALIANHLTFGQKYKCQASNNHGDSYKYFKLLEIIKPEKPDEVEFYNATDDRIQFKILWKGDVGFPIDGFDIQYLKENEPRKNKNVLSEVEWRRGKLVEVEMDDSEDPEFEGFLATLNNLEAETTYFVRLRITNAAGKSAWSHSILASTTTKSEVEEEVTDTPTSEATPIVNVGTSSEVTFYGIFFAGGILVVAVACMFAMRLV